MIESAMGWTALLRRAPNLVGGLFTAVVFSIVMLGMEALKGRDLEAADFAGVGTGALFVAAFTALVGRWRDAKDQKLPPGPATARNLNRTISSGKLPEQAVAEEWVLGLRKVIRQDRVGAWVLLLEFGLFTAWRIIMVIQLPTAHIGVFPYVILISGLALMLGGYVTGRRRDGS